MRRFVLCLVSLALISASPRAFAEGDSGFKFLEVKVLDPGGKPLADVDVEVNIDGMQFPMPTNDEGKISLNVPGAAKSRLELRVKHDEFAAVSASWQGGKSIPEEFTIPLVKGVPIGGANVYADQWRGHQTLPTKIYRGETDSEGLWQSDSMPAKEGLHFGFSKNGHMSTDNRLYVARDEPYTIVMPWPLVVSGNVVDAESGLPLETFNVVQGIDWGDQHNPIHWERHNDQQGSDGKYHTEFTYPRAGHYVRIEADGYRPEVSRMLKD